MKFSRRTSIIAGVLILVAYSVVGSGNPEAKTMSMTLEVLSGLSVIAIAAILFPIFKQFQRNLSYSYLIARILEGLMLIITGFLYLSHTSRSLELHAMIHAVHGYVFAIAALIFYYLLYQSKLVPRWLSIWGVIGAILVVVVSLLEAAGLISQMIILRLPIVLNEFVLAIWLIVKGFEETEQKSPSG